MNHYSVYVEDATVPDVALPLYATRSRKTTKGAAASSQKTDLFVPQKSDLFLSTPSVDEAMSLLMNGCRNSVIHTFQMKQAKHLEPAMLQRLVEGAPTFLVRELDLGVSTAPNVPEGLLLDAVRAFRDVERILICPRIDFPDENSAILKHCLHAGIVDVTFVAAFWGYDTAISEDDILKFAGGDDADRSGARSLTLRSSKFSPKFFKHLVKVSYRFVMAP